MRSVYVEAMKDLCGFCESIGAVGDPTHKATTQSPQSHRAIAQRDFPAHRRETGGCDNDSRYSQSQAAVHTPRQHSAYPPSNAPSGRVNGKPRRPAARDICADSRYASGLTFPAGSVVPPAPAPHRGQRRCRCTRNSRVESQLQTSGLSGQPDSFGFPE